MCNVSISGQQRPWSACAHAQADLGLRCPLIPRMHVRRNTRKGPLCSFGQHRSPSVVHSHSVIIAFLVRLYIQCIIEIVVNTGEQRMFRSDVQTAWVCKLIWTFALRIKQKGLFPTLHIMFDNDTFQIVRICIYILTFIYSRTRFLLKIVFPLLQKSGKFKMMKLQQLSPLTARSTTLLILDSSLNLMFR